jgi:hypothetical protein
MRIMTIDTLDMSGCHGWRFLQVVNAFVSDDIVSAESGQIGSQIRAGNGTVVAVQAIFLRPGIMK